MAKQPIILPAKLRRLVFNQSTGLYDAEEGGILYHLTFEQMNHLKAFYNCTQSNPATYELWYNDLNKVEKQQVKRSGNLPSQSNNFFPDVEPEY